MQQHTPKNDCSCFIQYITSCIDPTLVLQQLEGQHWIFVNSSTHSVSATIVQKWSKKWTTTMASDCIHSTTHTHTRTGRKKCVFANHFRQVYSTTCVESGNTAVRLLHSPSVSQHLSFYLLVFFSLTALCTRVCFVSFIFEYVWLLLLAYSITV